MKRLIIIILLLSAFLSGCEKISDPQQKSSNSGVYPSTYMKLDSALIDQKRSDYMNKNQHLGTSLNTFGFCDWNGDPLLRGTPPYKGDVSESEAKTIIKEFVLKNSSETGISNPEYLDFSKPDKDTGYAGSILWFFQTQNQKVDNIEILNSSILFVLQNKCIVTCLHNWYPEVYIPDNFNYDQAKAKSVLVGQQITYGSWGGAGTTKTICENDLGKCSYDLKIWPVDFSDKIELHVCWKINSPALNYNFYVLQQPSCSKT